MIIKRIKLHNIRSYRDENIELRDGTLLFEGDIGSGKTSILMALEFALFGTMEGGFYDKILRKGENEGFAEITFEHGGEKYTAYRSIKKVRGKPRSDESYIITPKGKKIVSPSEIKSYILGLMGVRVSTKKRKSLPIITYAIYTPQETMKNILEGGDEERMEVIRRIFKLDDYKIARDNVGSISSNLKSEIKAIRMRGEDLKKMKEKYEEEVERIEEKEREWEEKKKKVEEEKEKFKDLEKKLRNEREKRDRYIEITEKINKIKAEFKSNNDELKKEEERIEELRGIENKVRNMEDKVKRYRELKKERDKLKEKVDRLHSLEREKRGLEAELKNIKDMRERLKKLQIEVMEKREESEKLKKTMKKEDVERSKREIEEKINYLREIRGRNISKMEELKNELEEYKKLGAICPKCKRPLSKEHKEKLIRETQERIKKVEGNLNNVDEKIKDLEKEMQRIQREIEEIQRVERKIAKFEGEMKKDDDEIRRIEEKLKEGKNLEMNLRKINEEINILKKIEEKYGNVERDIEELEPLWRDYNTLMGVLRDKERIEESIKERKEKIEEMKRELKENEKMREELEYSEENYRMVEEDYGRKYKELADLKSTLRGIEENLREWRKNREFLEREIKEMEEEIERGEKLGDFRLWLEEKFIPSLESIERSALMSINEQFRILFERWFQDLLGESDYDATIDEDFKPIIRYEKYDMPISTLSGGERTSVALAYRLALNTMVKRALSLKTNILILDEPTDGFSKDQLYKLKDILGKMETDQIIIVSHEKELENIADSIYVVEKKNGFSQVKII